MIRSQRVLARGVAVATVAAACALQASAQSFQSTPGQIPVNGGYTENVDFADVDLDGDLDAVLAEGGDSGNDQNNMWINRGFEAGGTIGFFADRTAVHLPTILDDSRDVDFVDIDHDGDMDLYISNTSAVSSQTNRWWINMGGLQLGTAGTFTDQTANHWVNVGMNNGTTTFSSIAPSTALASGGFIDWSCDCIFGDLDNDGDMDLFHSTYGGVFGGQVPSRIFRNDGSGHFEEFNPSHFQLTGTTIANGNPGLWCEGVQMHQTTNTTGTQCDIADTPLGVELGDLDGDLDIDVLQGSRNNPPPRMYFNRLSDTGTFSAFRDVTYAQGYTPSVTGQDNYEQELGDFDADDDLDIYGLNWPGLSDVTLRNDGTGFFTNAYTLASSQSDDNEGDFFDYDNDGLLDLFVTNFSGQDKLYHNPGAPNFQLVYVTNTELPSYSNTGLGGDSCDVDADGDYDFLVANDGGQAEVFLKNVNQIPDTTAPRANHLEQAPNSSGGTATPIRVHIYDNSSWDVTRYDVVLLQYSTNGGGSWTDVPMYYSGGQIFRGVIPASVVGNVDYRVQATDEHGNVGLSVVKSFFVGCSATVNYCTAGTTSNGCNALMSGSGMASASATSGFTLTTSNVEGQRQGLIFYGINGRKASVWAPGSSSFVCVKAPVQRTGTQNSGGTAGACDGSFTLDWNAYMAAHPGALGQPITAGMLINTQAWFRDPSAPSTTNLSDGLEFSLCP